MNWSLEQIDRGVFHAIRKLVVAAGYYPDILLYQPSNPTNLAAFQAAKTAIITSGKELIAVSGVGDNSSRDALVKNEIIINRHAPVVAGIGFFGGVEFKANGDPSNPATTYNREQTPANTYKIGYEVTYICTSTKYDRLLESFLRKALTKTYLYGYDENGIKLPDLFNFSSDSNPMNMIDDKYIERMYKFTAGEVLLDENEVIRSGVVQIIDPLPEAYPTNLITDDLFEQSS